MKYSGGYLNEQEAIAHADLFRFAIEEKLAWPSPSERLTVDGLEMIRVVRGKLDAEGGMEVIIRGKKPRSDTVVGAVEHRQLAMIRRLEKAKAGIKEGAAKHFMLRADFKAEVAAGQWPRMKRRALRGAPKSTGDTRVVSIEKSYLKQRHDLLTKRNVQRDAAIATLVGPVMDDEPYKLIIRVGQLSPPVGTVNAEDFSTTASINVDKKARAVIKIYEHLRQRDNDEREVVEDLLQKLSTEDLYSEEDISSLMFEFKQALMVWRNGVSTPKIIQLVN
jgi:hypothetical protein